MSWLAMVAVGSGATPDYLRIRDYTIMAGRPFTGHDDTIGLPLSTAKKKVRVASV
jgi:hypothetical protein